MYTINYQIPIHLKLKFNDKLCMLQVWLQQTHGENGKTHWVQGKTQHTSLYESNKSKLKLYLRPYMSKSLNWSNIWCNGVLVLIMKHLFECKTNLFKNKNKYNRVILICLPWFIYQCNCYLHPIQFAIYILFLECQLLLHTENVLCASFLEKNYNRIRG